ncbi:MAG: LicD family protein [Clostridia bacterium]|nr:LicD family protein [Clostridia bacterium]
MRRASALPPFYGYVDRYIWDKSDFAETVELPFEDMTITCPKEYDKVLRKRYGDYNVFVKGGAVHTFVVVDTETPYAERLSEHRQK